MIREERKEGMGKERGRLDGMSYKIDVGGGWMWVMGVGCQSAGGGAG